MHNVEVFVRRPLYPGEEFNPENELPESDSESVDGQLPYRRISKGIPLILDSCGGCYLNIYGILLFDDPGKAIKTKKRTIRLSLQGHSEVNWTGHGILTYQQKKEVMNYKGVLLQDSEELPDPNAEGKIAIPFAIIHRTLETLPITFRSASAQISYAITFRFAHVDVMSSDIREFSVPVTVIPPWPAAQPPDDTPLHASDDGHRVILDVDGEIQGNANMRFEEETNWIRPRILHNLVDNHIPTPAYSEVDEPSEAYSPPNGPLFSMNSKAFSEGDLRRRLSRSFPDLVSLRAPLSYESSVIPVQDGDPLPYQEQDPLKDVLIRPISLESLRNSGAVSLNESVSSSSNTLAGLDAPPLPSTNSTHSSLMPRMSFPKISSAITKTLSGRRSLFNTNHRPRFDFSVDDDSDDDNETPLNNTGIGGSSNTLDASANSIALPLPSTGSSNSGLISRISFPKISSAVSKTLSGRRSLFNTNHRPRFDFAVDDDSDDEEDYGTPQPQPQEYGLPSPGKELDFLPLFRIVVPTTMTGPGSSIPVELLIHSIPLNYKAKSLQVTFRAAVKCNALGSSKVDFIPFHRFQLEFKETERFPFQQRITIHIPSAEEMGIYACGFKAPLIELSHQLSFSLKTEHQRKFRPGLQEVDYDLGTVSMELLR